MRPSPRLERAFRMLTDTALAIGALMLMLAIALPLTGRSAPLPYIAAAAISGLIALTAATQRRRYQQHP